MPVCELSQMLNAVPVPVLAIDADERIIAANPACVELLGEVTPGRNYLTSIRQPDLHDAIGQVLRDGKTRKSGYVERDGLREGVHEVVCAPLVLKESPHDADNREGVLVSFIDVSVRENARLIRRDFVANVSHELRTPLTALSGFVETLRGAAKNDPAARDRFLGIMESECLRMNRLVGDLLSLSAVEDEERLRPTETADVSAVLASVTQALKPVADAKGSTIEPDLPDGPLELAGDKDQLQQVFTNLIENALKYGRQGGIVTVAGEVSDQDPDLRQPSVRIHVRDQGEGIDARHIPRLTERFYRIDSHRSRELGGTGLGLAIVKHIVSRHQGRLRITSAPGEGSCFTVILPRS